MAYFDTTHTATNSRLRRMFAQIVAEFLAWREERATRDALGKLTDRELYDIGLMRSDLDQMTGSELRNG